MPFAIFHLSGGERIAIGESFIVCELKPRPQKKTPNGSNIRPINDDKGWDVVEPFDDVIALLQQATETPDENQKTTPEEARRQG